MIAFDGKLKMTLFLCFILTSIIMLIILNESIFEFVENFANWVRETDKEGMIVYSACVAIGTILFFPVFILTCGAGFIYAKVYGLAWGLWYATAVITVGGFVGAVGCLYIGRY